MKEFLTLFKSSIEGSFDEFSTQFLRELRHMLGSVTRLDQVGDRQLEGIAREVANPESISMLERSEGDKTMDLLLLPLSLGGGRVRYIVAEGSFGQVDLDQLHLLKWVYETRVETDRRIGEFRTAAVYDCDLGILSKSVVPALFDLEKSRAEDFGSSMVFLVLRLRQDSRLESIDLIRKQMRRTDYLFDLVPTEVLLLLVECSAYGGEAMTQRMKKILGPRLLSTGYSIYPEQGETAAVLIEEAQGALV